jgi:serine protease inhibitor
MRSRKRPIWLYPVIGAACLLLAVARPSLANSNNFDMSPLKASPAQVENARPSASAVTDFGTSLVADMAAKQPRKNIFVSPLSVFLALSMAETGSEGKTRAAIRHALSVPDGVSEEQLHDSAFAMLQSLRSQSGVELAIANGLWSDPSVPLSPTFVERCRKLYDAQATTLDLRQPSAANVINDWVKQNTRGKIPTIVTPDALRDAKAVLTNAVYFHGKWEHQFPKDKTQNAPFHLVNGQLKTVQMMHQISIPHAYRKGDGFEAAVLGYQGSQIQFYAILPDPGKRPEEVLTPAALKQLLSPGIAGELDLNLPRFTLDFSANLNAPLTRLGMGVAFDRHGAEFAPIGSPQFYISDVLHKTRLEVDEEGTVAAASTALNMKTAAVMVGQKKTLVFDRPFAVLLRDGASGAVLFAGVVYEPMR